ncbi:MAG: neutral zinc metallopeptidase [Propioniciclava sp.]|uniref:KPN_02809 family neutral zinc metallopeptidase n=1 Tax=Propioniciclava sp. TaxID=2038686 RepID=UPI0039E59D8F
MQFNPNASLDPSQMGGGGGGRRGGTIAVGGGASIVVLILAVIFGFNPAELLAASDPYHAETRAGSQPGGLAQSDTRFAGCRTGADIAQNPDCRWVAYTNSIQAYWGQVLSGYRPAKTVVFSGAVSTGCGQASSDLGPFYCPADETVYFDDSFFELMLPRMGAKGGLAAEAYVVAHEYGHHIQNLTGMMAKVQSAGNQSGPDSPQVRLELQADCYAGTWIAYAANDPNGIIKEVNRSDLYTALDAAQAVGDDHIQKTQTGRIRPESWTHGSSEQRRYWLNRGFSTGDPNQCTTFAADALTRR